MDAAAKYDGVYLIDKLYTEPDLLNSLLDVFLLFKEQRVVLADDIEAMFHQVQIIEEILVMELGTVRPPDVYQMLAMIFAAASSPCMAYYVLRMTALHNR